MFVSHFPSTEIKKCTGEYLAALKSSQQSSGSNQPHLPRCASDGSYSPTQCHYSFGYCWCVNVDTGKPIPNTTTKSSSLDCWKYSKLALFYCLQFVGSMFNVIIHAGEPCFTTTPLMQPPLYYDQQKLMQSFSYLKPHLTTVCICIQ